MARARRRGSSPHTRGALGRPRGDTDYETDHPRIRGEHVFREIRVRLQSGSSPHTRGARQSRRIGGDDIGIIPAYAGSTSVWPDTKWLKTDHPRIRGEHLPQTSCIADKQGSSPHTRGALRPSESILAILGIIPAYAGSTRCAVLSIKAPRDHPRIRGEHLNPLLMPSQRPGSSPHTRGALGGAHHGRENGGIIPAYAGSTDWGDFL